MPSASMALSQSDSRSVSTNSDTHGPATVGGSVPLKKRKAKAFAFHATASCMPPKEGNYKKRVWQSGPPRMTTSSSPSRSQNNVLPQSCAKQPPAAATKMATQKVSMPNLDDPSNSPPHPSGTVSLPQADDTHKEHGGLVDHSYTDYSVVPEAAIRMLNDEEDGVDAAALASFRKAHKSVSAAILATEKKKARDAVLDSMSPCPSAAKGEEEDEAEADVADEERQAKLKMLQRMYGGKGPMRKNSGGVVQPFPGKLMEVLDRGDMEDIIGWMPHGRAFLVRQPKSFASEILPRFFKQSKFMSFTRQLNLWGFKRITKGADQGAYYHELFLRGRPQLATRMRRQKIKGTGIKLTPNPAQEPNFYVLGKMRPLPALPKRCKPLPPLPPAMNAQDHRPTTNSDEETSKTEPPHSSSEHSLLSLQCGVEGAGQGLPHATDSSPPFLQKQQLVPHMHNGKVSANALLPSMVVDNPEARDHMPSSFAALNRTLLEDAAAAAAKRRDAAQLLLKELQRDKDTMATAMLQQKRLEAAAEQQAQQDAAATLSYNILSQAPPRGLGMALPAATRAPSTETASFVRSKNPMIANLQNQLLEAARALDQPAQASCVGVLGGGTGGGGALADSHSTSVLSSAFPQQQQSAVTSQRALAMAGLRARGEGLANGNFPSSTRGTPSLFHTNLRLGSGRHALMAPMRSPSVPRDQKDDVMSYFRGAMR